jgi:hypothetical protein
MKFKFVVILFLCLFIQINVYSAESKFRSDMSDLNTDIIVSIESLSEPEQFLNRGMSSKSLTPLRYPNFAVKPVEVIQGDILKLKIEISDENGIGNSAKPSQPLRLANR